MLNKLEHPFTFLATSSSWGLTLNSKPPGISRIAILPLSGNSTMMNSVRIKYDFFFRWWWRNVCYWTLIQFYVCLVPNLLKPYFYTPVSLLLFFFKCLFCLLSFKGSTFIFMSGLQKDCSNRYELHCCHGS